MKFKLEITCDGTAFDDNRELAVVDLLHTAAAIIRAHRCVYETAHAPLMRPLYDTNGNRVGWFMFEEDRQ